MAGTVYGEPVSVLLEGGAIGAILRLCSGSEI